MTNEQIEKIIELRKLGISYRSIATAMDLSMDSIRDSCKSRGLDGFGKDYSIPKSEVFNPWYDTVFRVGLPIDNPGNRVKACYLFLTVLRPW